MFKSKVFENNDVLNRVKEDFAENVSTIVVDYNNDNHIIKELSILAKDNNVSFHHFADYPIDENNYIVNYVDTSYYNPFFGDAPITPEMIMNTKKYNAESEAYKNSAYEVVHALYTMLGKTDKGYLLSDGFNGKESLIDWNQGQIYVWMDAMKNIDTLHLGYQQTLKDFRLERDDNIAKVVERINQPGSILNMAFNSIISGLKVLENDFCKLYDDDKMLKSISIKEYSSDHL